MQGSLATPARQGQLSAVSCQLSPAAIQGHTCWGYFPEHVFPCPDCVLPHGNATAEAHASQPPWVQGVRDINFSNDGRQFLSSSYDRVVKLWDTETGQVIRSFGEGKMFFVAKFHPDPDKQNVLMAGCQDKKVYQWDINSGDLVQVRPAELICQAGAKAVEDFVTSYSLLPGMLHSHLCKFLRSKL